MLKQPVRAVFQLFDQATGVRVAVRIRPLLAREATETRSIVEKVV